ncbi:MAG: ABC transporter, partial [Sphingomicrobium sp.]
MNDASALTARRSRIAWFVARLPLSGKIGLGLVIFWLVVALLGPLVAPHPIGAFITYDVFEGAGANHWLGSDYLGRDVLSRLLS